MHKYLFKLKFPQGHYIYTSVEVLLVSCMLNSYATYLLKLKKRKNIYVEYNRHVTCYTAHLTLVSTFSTPNVHYFSDSAD